VSDHLDLDALADVLAGVAAPEHLDGCAPCRARLAELAAALPTTAAALATLSAPPEPADLAARITSALADARTPPVPAGDVVPLAGRRTRGPWLWRAAAGVAAAAVLVTGAVLLTQHGGNTSTQAGRTGYQVSSTGTDYAAGASALTSALPALLKGGATPASAFSQSATADKTVPAPTQQGAVVDPLATLRSTPGLASCLAALSDPSEPGLPLALDYARYRGAPALVVVLPASKTGKVDVFVVGSGCSQSDARLLFFARLPKP
jgi:hypothetical protein